MLMPGTPDAKFEYWQWDILIADPETYSPREAEMVQRWIEHGEVYHCDVTLTAGGFKIYTTDLGDPCHTVELTLPQFVQDRVALTALSQLLHTVNQ